MEFSNCVLPLTCSDAQCEFTWASMRRARPNSAHLMRAMPIAPLVHSQQEVCAFAAWMANKGVREVSVANLDGPWLATRAARRYSPDESYQCRSLAVSNNPTTLQTDIATHTTLTARHRMADRSHPENTQTYCLNRLRATRISARQYACPYKSFCAFVDEISFIASLRAASSQFCAGACSSSLTGLSPLLEVFSADCCHKHAHVGARTNHLAAATSIRRQLQRVNCLLGVSSSLQICFSSEAS
eukprot:360186-Pleurochrysis_carterae.AAC.1